jgi:hypothetical protein
MFEAVENNWTASIAFEPSKIHSRMGWPQTEIFLHLLRTFSAMLLLATVRRRFTHLGLDFELQLRAAQRDVAFDQIKFLQLSFADIKTAQVVPYNCDSDPNIVHRSILRNLQTW